MKKVLALFVFTMAMSATTWADKQLTDYCLGTGGQIVNEWTCPATGSLKTGESCKVTNSLGQVMYYNGCSAPEGRYKTLFFKACIIHDFCYHSEPTSNNKSKADCDNQFLTNMKKICKATNPFSLECQGAAQTFYAAVANVGDSAFSCSKENVQYPQDMDQLPLPSPAPFFVDSAVR